MPLLEEREWLILLHAVIVLSGNVCHISGDICSQRRQRRSIGLQDRRLTHGGHIMQYRLPFSPLSIHATLLELRP